MPPRKIQFSQTALEKSNTTAQIYELSSVKSRWSWLLLGTLTLFFAAMVFWGFYGSMVESVNGVGITMLSKGSQRIIATGSGTISHLNIQSGSQLQAEQVVGQIYNAEGFFNIQKLENEFTTLKSEIETLSTALKKLTDKQLAIAAEKKHQLDALTEGQRAGNERAAAIAEMYHKLEQINASSKVEYYRSLDQRLQAQASLVSALIQNLGNDEASANLLWERQQKLVTLKQQLDGKRQELLLAQQLFREAYWIRAGFTGTVREVFKENGSYVRVGEEIALLDADPSKGIYLLAFVPVSEAKKVRNGMSAYFSPAAISSNDYGYMRAIVREVSPLPINPETIESELMNKSLTQMIANKEAMVRVILELIPDASNASGYKWTSSNEAGQAITNGMFGQVIINTEFRSPASYIIPGLRKVLRGKQKAPADSRP